MKLTDLLPGAVADYDILIGTNIVHDEDRHGMGISFACPHCVRAGQSPEDAQRLAVFFANPMDGKPHTDDVPVNRLWTRTGDSYETLTLSPSIDASASGHWHGFIVNGEVR